MPVLVSVDYNPNHSHKNYDVPPKKTDYQEEVEEEEDADGNWVQPRRRRAAGLKPDVEIRQNPAARARVAARAAAAAPVPQKKVYGAPVRAAYGRNRLLPPSEVDKGRAQKQPWVSPEKAKKLPDGSLSANYLEVDETTLLQDLARVSPKRRGKLLAALNGTEASLEKGGFGTVPPEEVGALALERSELSTAYLLDEQKSHPAALAWHKAPLVHSSPLNPSPNKEVPEPVLDPRRKFAAELLAQKEEADGADRNSSINKYSATAPMVQSEINYLELNVRRAPAASNKRTTALSEKAAAEQKKRRDAVILKVSKVAQYMDPRRAPARLRPGRGKAEGAGPEEKKPMDLYEFQSAVEQEIGLTFQLSDIFTIVKSFSSRTDKHVNWAEFVFWFWEVGAALNGSKKSSKGVGEKKRTNNEVVVTVEVNKWLGMEVNENGVVVAILPGGQAESLGVSKGSSIVRADGRRISSLKELKEVMSSARRKEQSTLALHLLAPPNGKQKEHIVSSKDSEAALKVQGMIRGQAARQRVGTLREERNAAVRVQGLARQRNARLRVAEIREEQEAAVRVQKIARQRNARIRVTGMREQRSAAVKVQGLIRKRDARQRVGSMREERDAAIRLQSLARGRSSRKRVVELRLQHSRQVEYDLNGRKKRVGFQVEDDVFGEDEFNYDEGGEYGITADGIEAVSTAEWTKESDLKSEQVANPMDWGWDSVNAGTPGNAQISGSPIDFTTPRSPPGFSAPAGSIPAFSALSTPGFSAPGSPKGFSAPGSPPDSAEPPGSPASSDNSDGSMGGDAADVASPTVYKSSDGNIGEKNVEGEATCAKSPSAGEVTNIDKSAKEAEAAAEAGTSAQASSKPPGSPIYSSYGEESGGEEEESDGEDDG